MHDVHRTFGAHVVLDGIELAVAAGETCVISGGNGTGKSTLLDVAVGALPATRGDVHIGGLSIDDGRARRGVGYAPAHAALPEQLAVHEWIDVVAALRGVSPRQVDDATTRWGLAAITDARLAALSLGQRRRLALATATMGAPPLLVLDEPTVGLDVEGVAFLVRTLEAHRAAGGAALVASHEAAFVDAIHATRRALVAGRIAPSATAGAAR